MVECEVAAVLTDIEGTTSSLSFVHEVLFPYARARMPHWLKLHQHRPEVAAALARLAAEQGLAADDLDAAVRVLDGFMAEDRKHTELKALQGLLWAEGYAAGDFHGHVYADAVVALREWVAAGIAVYVYSSGSVAAQRLLFGHSEAGDLTPLFSGYFDTTSGGKREVDSYRRIVAAIGLPASSIVFLSDVAEELTAARGAGLKVVGLDRDGRATASAVYPWVQSFAEIRLHRVAA